jgi:folate-binding protein YgfZ
MNDTPSMSDEPSATGAAPESGSLPYLGVIRFAGPDAAAFLQGQLSNDTRRLAAGATLLAAYSSPQGRVLAILHLLPHSSGILALLPREIVPPTIERLRKFVLRAKVQIEDLSGQFRVLGFHGAEPLREVNLQPPTTALGYVEHGGIGVGRVREGEGKERYWVVGSGESLARLGLGGAGAEGHGVDGAGAAARVEPARIEHDWRLADIRAGAPQVYAATVEMFVAQMLNLDRIDGISFTKGCFTGQEIVARTQHLGRIKRRNFRLRLPAGTWAIGQAVHLRDGRSGRLTELAAVPGGFEALAVLPLEAGGAADGGNTGEPAAAADPDSVTVDRVDAAQLPLPYSLVAEG